MAGDLRQGAAALGRRDTDAASEAYRRALEAEAANADQRREALDGLLAAAVESGRSRELATYLEGRSAAAPEAQRGLLLAGAVRCQRNVDGHLFGAIQRLGDEASNRPLRGELERLCAYLGQIADQQAREAQRLAVKAAQAARPPRESRVRGPARIDVPEPSRPSYSATPARAAPAPRTRRGAGVAPLHVPAPQAPQYASTRVLSVRKPPLVRPQVDRMAAIFLSRFYHRSTELAEEGLLEAAKAELATVIQLFPGTPQADQAAQYAIRLFRREQGVAEGAQADALVAYLQWVRTVVGPEGSEYAEYLALSNFSGHSDPKVVAREAEAFVARHPDSKWLDGVRLQLAVALDSLGQPDRAVEVLKPISSPLGSAHRLKAARILAWLYLLRGDAGHARPLLEALAAQSVSEEDATKARSLLQRMAALPLDGTRLPAAADPGKAEEALARALYDAGDRLLREGDAERAMDLFAHYLRMGKRLPGFWANSQRVERLKLKGQVDEE